MGYAALVFTIPAHSRRRAAALAEYFGSMAFPVTCTLLDAKRTLCISLKLFIANDLQNFCYLFRISHIRMGLPSRADRHRHAWSGIREAADDAESDQEEHDEEQEEDSRRKRRRRKAILFGLLSHLIQLRKKRYPGRPFPIKRKTRKDFWRVVRHFNGRQFRNAFRMTVLQFRTLTEKLRAILDVNKVMAEKSSGSIQAEVKVALLLRILAGACYQDLCMIFDIPASSVYNVFHRTLNALLQTFSLPGIPTEEEELKKMAKRFKCSRHGGSPLNGCIGALDGIAIKIRKPHALNHPSLYYCRKQFYAIPVQALVDSDYRFLCFSALCVGATHDSLSHSVSALGKYLREGKLKGPFWIAADEAYICTECLLTPFAKSQLDRSVLAKYKDSYNYFHSSLRMHVEQAFGMLVARFGILWRPLRFSLQTNTKIVLAAMLLHNFCIDNSDRADVMLPSEKRRNDRAFDIWYNQSRNELAEQHEAVVAAEIEGMDRSMAKSKARSEMVERLKYLRLPRPYGAHRFDADLETESPSA